jgi:hypothetical protein
LKENPCLLKMNPKLKENGDSRAIVFFQVALVDEAEARLVEGWHVGAGELLKEAPPPHRGKTPP